jgi:hypothetical protein
MQIVKCARDEDLYLEWSSVTETPTCVGTRAEMHAYLTSNPSRPPGYADRVLALVDEHGTSAPHLGCTWTSEGERYQNGGRLPRERMAECARRLLDAEPTASPDVLIADLLVPIDYGEAV